MRRLVLWRAAASQFDDGHFSVGHNIITCGIRELFWRFWPVNFSASLGGPNEEKVGFHPFAFPAISMVSGLLRSKVFNWNLC
jgi:hypothetical protein